MAVYLNKLQELKNLPPELHWFCSTYTPTAPDLNRVKTELPIGESVDLRREQACECLMLFSFEGDDARRIQEELGARIDEQLGRCDACVIAYYKSRQRLVENVDSLHTEEDVGDLIEIFNTRDIERIRRGLDGATRKLEATDPPGRHKDVLELPSQLALFEALCCEAFFADKSLLEEHFQHPFALVQTNRRLRITQYVPGATTFLFDTNHERWTWAIHTWSKYRSMPTEEDFEFAVRDPLLLNMRRVLGPVADLTIVQRLWYGVGLIIKKLDNNLVTHSLRALDIDVFRLALEHLNYDMEGLRYLTQTIRSLLELAPKDFWDSMGTISPTTFIEQVFNNPQFDRFMMKADEDEDYESSALKDMLAWIRPFMTSLETVHQAGACRSLGFQLLDRLQADRFPFHARVECKRTGLATLGWTLINCNKEGATLSPTGRIVAAETLEVTSAYVKEIIEIPSMPTDNKLHEHCADTCLKIVKVALALECKSLKTDQEALKQNKEVSDGYASYSPAIWDAVVQNLDRGNVAVAKAALVGINDLTGLEKFRVNVDEKPKANVDEVYAKAKGGFNVKFGRLTHLVCQILERINDFGPSDLDKLFRHSDTATALVASLFSPDANLYEAGVNLVKSISCESARKEAIGHLLKTFLETTLNAFSWSIRRISRNRTFASCPRMLKTSSDVLDILCDSQHGLLRTRSLTGIPEIKALENFWECQWEGLRVIYEMTEDWSRARVADSNVLKEFCRDTMQFSERFFDQYSVFATAIDSANPVKQEEGTTEALESKAGKGLLEHPARIMEAMSKWLRLRDLFLVEISVKLTHKVLDRLTELAMTLAEGPCEFLEQVINNGPQGRTHLKPQEKAELARALELNLGRAVAVADTDGEQSGPVSDRSREQSLAVKKRIKKRAKAGIIDLDAWRSRAKPSQPVVEVSDEEFGDSDILDQDLLSVSRSAELMKNMQPSIAASKKPTETRDRKPSTVPTREKKVLKGAKAILPSDADRALFREKREREREAKKKRDAETLAMVKKKAAVGITGQTLGEGSGLGSLGVKGKDHAPKASSMMLSSGSESESDNDLDQELFGPKPSKLPDAVREYQAARAVQAKYKGPIKKTRQVRSAKDMRARLAPDLTALHRTILGWDFFHDGDFPPGSERQDYSLVTNSFRTPTDYQSTFEPLLVLEAWQGFLKSKEEGNFKTFEIKVANRMTVDAFLEVSTTISMAEGKELGISEADVILMSKGQSPAAEARQPHCLARVFKVSRKKSTMEITYRANVGNSLVASMVPNSTLYGVKVSSITPLEREYGALMGLKYFDLCDEVIRARPSPLLDYPERQLGPLVANYSINIAQAKAVKSAVDNDAFTLIQGPPGSGKTKTIVAIVGALLTGSFGDKGVPIARPQINNGNVQRNGNGAASKKLLVCAPSNAAVDELVMRFKQGIKTADGNSQILSVIRLGRSDAINANVLDVTLEELVNARLNVASGKRNGAGDEIHKIMMEHKSTSDQLHALRTVVDGLKAGGKPVSAEQDREFEVLKRKKQQLSNQIDAARDSGDTAARDAEMSRRRVQQEILDGAHVICATLSGSGHEMFQGLNIEFETVVIDEAAQSIELSALIPLKYGCSKCILVGDPKQLPPTVLSREAARFQYEQSLFVRMQANSPNDVHLLDTQYRMHPEISLFPSNAFYDAKLLDGPGMAALRTRPWHHSKILGPYRFFDVQGTQQSAPRGHSLINIAEIEVALKLFQRLITDCKGYDFKGKIGIITPYKSQLRELRSRFAQTYGDSVLTTVEFNTTDAFQGRESEVIIFSCVRASFSGGIGFLSDIRRMNVGITRAKSSLWVLGNSQSLMRGEFWGRLIQDARTRDRYTSGDLAGLLRKPLLHLDSTVPARCTDSPVTRATSSNVDHDIEMIDAPASSAFTAAGRRSSVVGAFAPTNRHSSVATESPVDSRMLDNSAKMSSNPAGGANGLNPLGNCQKCGSFAHFTSRCDNPDAQNMKSNKCYRCGGSDHVRASCMRERCPICGAFGHTQKTCSSTAPLSKKERDRLTKTEADHKLFLQRLPEIQRKRQMGSHGMQVPVLRTTADTPSDTGPNILGGVQHVGEKRKRERSPPSDAPKGPKSASRASGLSQKDAFRRPSNGDQSLSRLPNGSQSGNRNGTSSHSTLPPRPSNAPSAMAEPRQVNRVGDRSRDLDAAQGAVRDSGQSTRPVNGSSQVIKAGDEPKGRPTARPALPQQNLVRPPKKKRDADPFIRPKKRP